jgi:hypothetical protein
VGKCIVDSVNLQDPQSGGNEAKNTVAFLELGWYCEELILLLYWSNKHVTAT